MPTTRKRKTRNIVRLALLDYVRILLMDGPRACRKAMMDRIPGSGKAEAFRMRKGGDDDPSIREAWNEHKDEILRIWKAEKRKGKPYGAKCFDG